MEEFCKNHNFSGFFETSAKDNIGIDKAAKFLIQKILDNTYTAKPKESGLVDPAAPSPSSSEKSKKEGTCCK
jgi:Ras-related protein Rab-32